ncbi:glutamate receptor ionotropic, kainate 2-like [Prorops nasuta]|uniref:glutamate receptor ionotropic, kainate 2-like n=1 Tax=Prorops nasuta TaxID=863751 RepID=UPI0034CED226
MNRFRIFSFAGLILLLLVPWNECAPPRTIKVGAIFHDGDEEYAVALEKAIDQVKYEHVAPAFDIQTVVKRISVNTDSFRTGKAVCELLEEGVVAIFGPPSPFTRGIVASIASRYDVPHIEYVWRNSQETEPTHMTFNLYPESGLLSKAIADLAKSRNWRDYVGIYDSNDALVRIQEALTIKRNKDRKMTIRKLVDDDDYRPILKEINSLPIHNMLVDVDTKRIPQFFHQAKEMKMITDYCSFVIANLDSGNLPLLPVRNGTVANITGLSLLKDDNIKPEGINSVESAVLYDAVFFLHIVLEALNARNSAGEEQLLIDPVPLSCDGTEKYSAGLNITNLMRDPTIPREGKLTGEISFDDNGRRLAKLRIVDFGNKVFSIGNWDDKSGLAFDPTNDEMEKESRNPPNDKFFKISTKIGAPYVMEAAGPSDNNAVQIDKKYYKGYCIDLIEKIAKLIDVKYEFELVPDNQHGSFNKKTNTWNGLIKRLLDHKADLAICDFTITYERQKIVDFTMPFMNLGISILFRKAEQKEPNLFSFLSPLSTDVWMYMATAYLAVSIMLFIQARMAPGEWDNPHPCKDDPEELENVFDLKNSFWLTIGSLMQQGSDILPKAPSIRMLVSAWWFFVLIMVSSYTANLAAFLTVDKMDAPINGVEDLAKQTKIKYGCLKGGSTSQFFQNSNYTTYQKMWTTMAETKPSVFTADNDEGVDRVIKGKRLYAFLMESTTIEYKMERECDLEKVGSLIDNKGYGIALPLNSPYRTRINGAILSMQENGQLLELKEKWWKEQGGGKCDNKDADSENSNELGLANVGGVFLVLMCGVGFSCLVGIFEFLWNVRKVAVEEKITPWEALIAELKFAINLSAETKPVKISKSITSSTSSGNSSGSAEGGIGRAASAARSFVGSFLRLDVMGDKFDRENTANRNKHS